MTFSVCQRYKGLGNSVGDSFLFNHRLKWTLQTFGKKENTEICGRDVCEDAGLGTKIETRQNADELTYLIIGIS